MHDDDRYIEFLGCSVISTGRADQHRSCIDLRNVNAGYYMEIIIDGELRPEVGGERQSSVTVWARHGI